MTQTQSDNGGVLQLNSMETGQVLKGFCLIPLIDGAEIKINTEKMEGTATGNCITSDFQTMKSIEAMYQTCALLGLHMFPRPQNMVRMETMSDVQFYYKTRNSGEFELRAQFIGKELDSNKRCHRIICHFNASAQKNLETIAIARITIMVYAPREIPDIIMPGMTQHQKEAEWKKFGEANAEAIKTACKTSPRPGDIGCD